MDDLDVIRLAAMDIISIERIARGGDGSEGEISRWVADEPQDPPHPLQVIHQSRGTVFGRNTCPPRRMQKDRNPVSLDTGPKQGRSERVREKDES
jgi:hypothetical protein